MSAEGPKYGKGRLALVAQFSVCGNPRMVTVIAEAGESLADAHMRTEFDAGRPADFVRGDDGVLWPVPAVTP